jgi:hypothetical protein
METTGWRVDQILETPSYHTGHSTWDRRILPVWTLAECGRLLGIIKFQEGQCFCNRLGIHRGYVIKLAISMIHAAKCCNAQRYKY